MQERAKSTQVTPITSHAIKSAVIRFAGDSGDGMQVVGEQFTSSTASQGNDLATLPDYPAEIRAPAGTLFGVSGFQIQFGSEEVYTPGDVPDVLVAMNPAALRTNVNDLRQGGLLIANSGAFTKANLDKAGYATNPLEDGSLAQFDVMAIDITRLTNLAVKPAGLGGKDANRCKNFWTLGLTYWIYSRPLESTLAWLESKFRKRPDLALANSLALKAGNAYGETNELFHHRYHIPAAHLQSGEYRSISGNTALAWGLLAAAHRADRSLVLGSYPITPATDLLQELSKLRHLNVTTVQAEDEIAAVCVAIGASYAGSIGVTTTSGPGLALKMEAIGLAVALELPLIIVDVQRAGPSTGLPTKTEQADLLQALYGRPGESPLCVLASSTPANCFDTAIEAVRLATKYMTPVIVLSDSTLGNGAEPWNIPSFESLPDLRLSQSLPSAEDFKPYQRDPATLARTWVIPGQKGYEYRIGGLEKDATTGDVSNDPLNHEKMSELRAAKIANIAADIPEAQLDFGPARGGLLVVGWGSSYGPIHEAVRRVAAKGQLVSHLHLMHINPFPRNLGKVLTCFDRILVPELNMGQLAQLLRARFGVPIHSFNKLQGRPFSASELEHHLESFVCN
jgi:2-oxoglutarate/2-oxoacid ferredoxin oxidoreductase subunit alpha